MDENENESKAYGVNNQQGYNTSIRLKVPARDAATHSRVVNQYAIAGNEEDVGDEETGDEEVGKSNGVRMIGKDSYDDEVEDEDEDDVTGDEDDEDEDEDEDDDNVGGKRYNGKVGDLGMERPQKKRKLKNLISNYEFAPRVRTPSVDVAVQPQPLSIVGRDKGTNVGSSWTDRETLALLDAWGDRFLKLGRKSISSVEWREVAEKVSQETNIDRTDTQCRNRLDTLKKKYRKEKMESSVGGGGVSKWVFFRKMDMLLCSPTDRPSSLSCGIDSGEYVFMNPNVYLNRANGLDEMRDSPENSESSRDDGDNSDGPPPRRKTKNRGTGDSSSFRLLADSIQKFSEIYEDIEVNKRKQMVELENMRMDFQRQIETQRRQILERAQAEIVKIRQGCDDDNDISAENLSR